jgi:hypothetical protein
LLINCQIFLKMQVFIKICHILFILKIQARQKKKARRNPTFLIRSCRNVVCLFILTIFCIPPPFRNIFLIILVKKSRNEKTKTFLKDLLGCNICTRLRYYCH